MPAQSTVTVDRNVPIPMRDGVKLFADIYRPAAPGPCPTLLQRTPYNKSAPQTLIAFILRATAAGYAVVCQDVRGRFASEGVFHCFINERQDGYDTLEWLAAQSWCDGNVGMFGQSYVGLTQWQAAISGHSALKAIVPGVTADNYHDGWTYQGGAFELSFNLSWVLSNLVLDTIKRREMSDAEAATTYDRVLSAADDMANEFTRLPLAGHPLLSTDAPYYDEWLAHPTYDAFWETLNVSQHHHAITVPALNWGGWYDIFLKGTIGNFTGMRQHAPAEVGRRQRLLLGPWNHGGLRSGNPIGAVDFGMRATGAEIDVDGLHLRWYDRWLRGEANGVDDEPPVRIFVMGSNTWRSENQWPLEGTDWQAWYLHSQGHANSLDGDGALGPGEPANEPPDQYTYDPADPTPTRGGGLCCNHVFSLGGAFDQRCVEASEQVLVYTSDELRQPLEVTGPIRVRLFAASTAPDTDFTAKLVDVAPDGFARNLTDGILRARYRNSMSKLELLSPGDVTELEIDLVATSNCFLPGHRIRIEIASSNFPRFDRNPNTGELPGTSENFVTASQTVFHDRNYPSCIILPVISSS